MEMRLLGNSGLRVSVLSYGALTFGGTGEYFSALGQTKEEEARILIKACLDAGVNLFDTADSYSDGQSEYILGKALHGLRDQVVLATKVFGRMGEGPNEVGLSRHHIIQACEASLRRLNTDFIDLYQAHGFDALTPLEETLEAFTRLVQSGKVRYIGCSNYSGWHLMKALSVSEREHFIPYVSQQVYYSLLARELENELVPLSLDQNIGILVWSPLSGGFLTGKFRRGQPRPAEARRSKVDDLVINTPEEQAYDIVEKMDGIAQERGVSVAQVALNWLFCKPGVTSVIVGARNLKQLSDNLIAASWRLTDEEVQQLDQVSKVTPVYPYWHQRKYSSERNPWGVV